MSFDEIIEDYPNLGKDDVRAALLYAAENIGKYIPLPKKGKRYAVTRR